LTSTCQNQESCKHFYTDNIIAMIYNSINLNPLLLQFKEITEDEILDYSLIEYDNHLRLSVNKHNGQPAIDSLQTDTMTATRRSSESSDSDRTAIQAMMDTRTFTKANGDETDSDRNSFDLMMGTSTNTFTTKETSDSDRDLSLLQTLLDTTTLTESRETTDKD